MVDQTTERDWRVMRFENAEGRYAEVGTYLGANTVPVPPGYKLVSSTPMVPVSRLAGAVEALEAIRDHGKIEGHECWALHQGDCAEVFQEIARATLARLGGQSA